MSHITVVGDSLWDIEIRGSATRLAPDAPVPVIEHTSQSERPGGAALAATLAARDGHDITFITWLGADDHATDLRRFLLAEGIDVIGLPLVRGVTPVKTRIGTAGQTLLRVDLGCEPHEGTPMRTAAISAHVSRSDVVLVSDYGRGITSDPMLRLTLRSTNVPVIWDPHPKGSHPVRGAYIVTPNLAEASLHSQEEGPLRKAMALQAQWHADCVVVTAGAHGVHVSAAPLTAHIPTTPLAGLDTCGAGDRFASALAGEVPEGHDLMTALRRATQRATEFVAAGAAATVSIMKDVRVQEHNVPFTKAGGV